jgi:hypothetical protein
LQKGNINSSSRIEVEDKKAFGLLTKLNEVNFGGLKES